MKGVVVSLQEFVSLLFLVALAVGLGGAVFRMLGRRKLRCLGKRCRRRCAQCGLWEEIRPEEPKFGHCSHCGGVTRRGRTRKLG
ncbi:hypothetical protein [Roseibacillus ishigakijimensis]|uniref:Uncharacterized protein n=1 Tax=Roseibacillus ishigakijimensis TaxID=454146 RepID=A0A934RWE8_9BACT|nr:hypothetical protein [Roseibacillus ishigakijimensis]MBK1835395.1 hypothetical protein [Roseibacillus ishigakijimensis]